MQNAQAYNTFIPIYMDYWGGNTKDILNVSRDSLSHQQLEKNETIFEKSAICLAKIYYEILKSLINSNELEKFCTIKRKIFDILLIKVVHLMLWAGVDISPLEESIRTELSSLDGYNDGHNFEDKKNVGDIIFSNELKVLDDGYGVIGFSRIPFFFKERKINRITVNSDKKIQLIFGKEYNKRDTVEYVGDTFAVFLHNDYDNYKVPVPFGFEDIAVNETRYDEFRLSGIYITYLWDDFDKIKETYTERIKNGEEIEKMADEIVPVSRTDKKPATNVLRNICYDRAFNRELPYDEAWHKVRDTYRKFVIKVMEAVKWLLDNGYIEPTDNNNEEMEEQ